MKRLEEKRVELSKVIGMGDVFLVVCYFDFIIIIKYWIMIIQVRFEEVLVWVKQYQQRLVGVLVGFIVKQELLEILLVWLQWVEIILIEKDKEVIFQEIEEVKIFIVEYQIFMEEMIRKQFDVDKVIKIYKRRVIDFFLLQFYIFVLDKG